MRLMGLSRTLHWLSWFCNGLLTSAVTIAIIVALVCIEWKAETGRVGCY